MENNAGRDRTRLYRSGGRGRWAGFDVLDKHILLHIKRCRAAAAEHVAAQRTVANDEEGAQGRLEAAKKEHELAWALRKSAAKHYLNYDE